jgi:hypothetical protein
MMTASTFLVTCFYVVMLINECLGLSETVMINAFYCCTYGVLLVHLTGLLMKLGRVIKQILNEKQEPLERHMILAL